MSGWNIANVGATPTRGEPPADDLQTFGATLKRDFEAARASGRVTRDAAGLAYSALISPTAAGVSLRDLPADVAQKILASRAEAMQQFFDSWAESIRVNAERDKKADQKRFLEKTRCRALARAQRWLQPSPSPRRADPTTEPKDHAAKPQRPLAAAFDAASVNNAGVPAGSRRG
jgi:hypothetical protein